MQIYSFTYCKKCKAKLQTRLYIEKDTLYQEVDVDCECAKNAQQSEQADVLVTCTNCGAYHSIYIPCPGGSAQVAHR